MHSVVRHTLFPEEEYMETEFDLADTTNLSWQSLESSPSTSLLYSKPNRNIDSNNNNNSIDNDTQKQQNLFSSAHSSSIMDHVQFAHAYLNNKKALSHLIYHGKEYQISNTQELFNMFQQWNRRGILHMQLHLSEKTLTAPIMRAFYHFQIPRIAQDARLILDVETSKMAAVLLAHPQISNQDRVYIMVRKCTLEDVIRDLEPYSHRSSAPVILYRLVVDKSDFEYNLWIEQAYTWYPLVYSLVLKHDIATSWIQQMQFMYLLTEWECSMIQPSQANLDTLYRIVLPVNSFLQKFHLSLDLDHVSSFFAYEPLRHAIQRPLSDRFVESCIAMTTTTRGKNVSWTSKTSNASSFLPETCSFFTWVMFLLSRHATLTHLSLENMILDISSDEYRNKIWQDVWIHIRSLNLYRVYLHNQHRRFFWSLPMLQLYNETKSITADRFLSNDAIDALQYSHADIQIEHIDLRDMDLHHYSSNSYESACIANFIFIRRHFFHYSTKASDSATRQTRA